MATKFYKLSGSGNDFLALPEPETAPTSEEIRAWCRRGVSIGADGLIVIRRGADSPSGTGTPVVEMTYWNADGYPADLCLNGTRCAARLAFELGWAKPADPLAIRTDAGTWTARLLPGARIALDLPLPQDEVQRFTLEALGATYEAHWLSIGVPHLVLLWPESLATAPVKTLGARLRHHSALGPSGANVDFVRFPEEGDRHRMEIRTFERGVEGETLSCGTGVLASAAVGLTLGLAAMPLTVSTQGGFELEVSTDAAAGAPPQSWSLIGDARIVAAGELWPEAGDSPPAPPWGTSR